MTTRRKFLTTTGILTGVKTYFKKVKDHFDCKEHKGCNIIEKETILGNAKYRYYCEAHQKIKGLFIPLDLHSSMPPPPKRKVTAKTTDILK